MADVQLLAGGLLYSGWKGMTIQRGMEQCSGAFSLSVSELWPGVTRATQIKPGAACEVRVNGATLITGYVDVVDMRMDGTQHDVAVQGRDRTADLIDCSAVHKGGQWKGLRIEQIAAELAAPFKVKVRAEVDTGKPLGSFALQTGETVFEAIERAARIRALLVLTDGKGSLVLTRASTGAQVATLQLGVNLRSLKARFDLHERFSSYMVVGQAQGTDWWNGAGAAQVVALAKDVGVPRYRPLLLMHEAQDSAATFAQRAQWEANVRAARSVTVEATVDGWEHSAGLWQPNSLVRVVAEALRLDDDLLINSVEFTLDAQGQSTKLQMTRADAYTLLPIKETAGAIFWDLPKTQHVPADARPRGGS